MSKHNRAFKLKIAELALSEGSIAIGKQFSLSPQMVRYWVTLYRIHGRDSFTSAEKPYTRDFKLKVLNAMQTNNWSLSYTSAYFDLSSPGILYQWQRHYAHDGISRLQPMKKGRPRMTSRPSEAKPSEQMTDKELREELDYLRAENAVLKKLEALAQVKKKKAKKRP